MNYWYVIEWRPDHSGYADTDSLEQANEIAMRRIKRGDTHVMIQKVSNL